MSPSTPAAEAPPAHPRHGVLEDAQAIVTGSLLAAFGIVLFKQAGLVSGGTVGIALLLHYASNVDVAWCFALANLPFYALACWRMGREFTVKTLASVTLTSFFTAWLPQALFVDVHSSWIAALLGGLLCGVGMLVLFRHRASLGGLNVLVLYLQEKFGWSPGRTQLAIDAVLVAGGAMWVGDAAKFAASVLAVAVLNLVLAVNHRPDRYRP